MASRHVLFGLGWAVAIGLLVVLFTYTFSISDLTEFIALTKSAKPMWIIAMALTELGTYFCTAGMYSVMLRSLGHKVSIRRLLPLSLEKLAIDQFIPTAGVGGSALVVQGLKRSGATRQAAIGMVVTGLAAWYCAGDIAGLFGLWMVRDSAVALPGALTVAGIYFAISAFIIFVTLKGVRTHTFGKIKKLLPGKTLDTFFTEMAQTHDLGLVTKFGFSKIVAFQIGNILFDAATLAFAFLAIGQPIPYIYALAAYALANMAATITVLPGGIGVFEGGTVAILSLLGMPPAAALAATLLYRGFSVWLPLVPGLLLARREIHHGYNNRG
ncbi:MAG: lysylphosphatidylglycerol synthase transmembrane domain-containing protein [Patescibacteria group bacterium]